MSAAEPAWFSALGQPLDEAERAEIAAYLSGFGLLASVHPVSSWRHAFEVCARPAAAWWNTEEAERARLEARAKLDPADRHGLALSEALRGAAALAARRAGCSDCALIYAAAGAASYAVYEERLARAAAVPAEHPFLHKYALYCGGRWPLGVFDGKFAIF